MKPSNPKDALGVRKVPLHVLPCNVLLEQGLALLEGGCKYGTHNWRVAGVRASVYYDAAMGHLMDWWEGQDLDPDSGLSHVAKAIASLIVLRDAMMREMWNDDRPPTNGRMGWKSEMNVQAGAILDRFPVKVEPYTELGERGVEQPVVDPPPSPPLATATGTFLDTVGSVYALTRRTDLETDDQLRARCLLSSGVEIQRRVLTESDVDFRTRIADHIRLAQNGDNHG